MSAAPLVRPLTLDEFENLPDADGIQELLDGALVQMPPPKRRHSEIWKNIAQLLSNHLDASRIWPEAGFVIGTHCLQPDVAVIFPGQRTERGWFAGASLVAIEVASRGNTPEELEWKKDLYLAHGAREVWIAYDKTRTVVVHDRDGHAVSHGAHFDSAAIGARIAVADVFA